MVWGRTFPLIGLLSVDGKKGRWNRGANFLQPVARWKGKEREVTILSAER